MQRAQSMNTKRLLIGSLIIASGLTLIRKLFTSQSPGNPVTTDTSYDAIDTYIEEQVRHLSIPGVSMAIVEGDRLVHYRGFGRAHSNAEAPTLQTPFFIGSVTKSITALAIMQLVEAGKVELDAPVQRYLPWFHLADRAASSQITVQHLLNHTSGLSMLQGQQILSELDEGPHATESQLRALATAKLSSPAGEKFAYNNTNYNLLGSIIEAASGESYPDYVQEHIFDPLEMWHSYFSKAVAQKNNLAMGHRYWFGIPIPTPNLPQPIGSLPSGQLISCAEDLAHFLVAQLNAGRYGNVQILSDAGIDEMHRGTIEMTVMGFSIGEYGMGWESRVEADTTLVSHSGIVPEFGAFAGLVPEQKKGIVLLYNANHAMIKLTFDEFGVGALERLAGVTPSRKSFGFMPWLMRSMALIPIFQLIGVLLTFKRINQWHSEPASLPSRGRLWRQHILGPLLPNLLVAATLYPAFSKMRGWLELFMADFSWIARLSGSFAAIWAFLRTVLLLRAWRKSQRTN
jgi:CubicO group peptidase (beta-lactamase class C family)